MAWQTSWSLETSGQLVTGVSCGGKRECWRWWLQWAWEKEQEAVSESQKAKEMRLADFPVVFSRVARKGGGSREGVLRKIGLLNEPIFCLGCPSWRNCPPSLKPVMKASRVILDPTPKTSLLFGPTQLPYQDLCFWLPDLWGSACGSKDLSLVLAFLFIFFKFFIFFVLDFLEN